MERRIGKLIGQKAETGNVGGPSEPRWDKLSEGDLERIARLRALYVDWPGHGIDAAKIERRHIGGSRAAFEGPVAGVQAFEVDRLAGLAFERRSEVAAPGELMVLAVDRMVAGDAHRMSFKSVAKSRRRAPMEPVARRRRSVDAARGGTGPDTCSCGRHCLTAWASLLPRWIAAGRDEAGADHFLM